MKKYLIIGSILFLTACGNSAPQDVSLDTSRGAPNEADMSLASSEQPQTASNNKNGLTLEFLKDSVPLNTFAFFGRPVSAASQEPGSQYYRIDAVLKSWDPQSKRSESILDMKVEQIGGEGSEYLANFAVSPDGRKVALVIQSKAPYGSSTCDPTHPVSRVEIVDLSKKSVTNILPYSLNRNIFDIIWKSSSELEVIAKVECQSDAKQEVEKREHLLSLRADGSNKEKPTLVPSDFGDYGYAKQGRILTLHDLLEDSDGAILGGMLGNFEVFDGAFPKDSVRCQGGGGFDGSKLNFPLYKERIIKGKKICLKYPPYILQQFAFGAGDSMLAYLAREGIFKRKLSPQEAEYFKSSTFDLPVHGVAIYELQSGENYIIESDIVTRPEWVGPKLGPNSTEEVSANPEVRPLVPRVPRN